MFVLEGIIGSANPLRGGLCWWWFGSWITVVGEVGGEAGRVVVEVVGVISTWFGDMEGEKMFGGRRADLRG